MAALQIQQLEETTLGGVAQAWATIVWSVIPVAHQYVQANPPDIVTIEDDEFRINMNNMEPLRRYVMEFDGSTYVIWKNGDGALVMEEVEV